MTNGDYMHHQSVSKTITTTLLALLAFAANSVLCRLALGEGIIDAASFTNFRLLSGSIMLIIILVITNKTKQTNTTTAKGSWLSASMLFLYALCFSYAYVSLDTATGALILFGAVQITMILITLYTGTKLHYSEWLGMLVAFFGFIYLILPDINSPSVYGFVLMTLSGIGWGAYSILGKKCADPLSDTAFNFIRTTPIVIILLVLNANYMQISGLGLLYAVISGALTSGIGYAIWYIALRGLSTTQAAVVQLSVPAIAAIGGILFVNEAITLRLSTSALLILGGILIVILGRKYLLKN